jgi:ribonuclease Y
MPLGLLLNKKSMPNELIDLIIIAGGLVGGAMVGLFLLKPKAVADLEAVQRKSEELLAKSSEESVDVQKRAQADIELMQKRGIDHEEKSKIQAEKIEKLILSKEEQLKGKEQKNAEIKGLLDQEEAAIKNLEEKNKDLEKEMTLKLAQKTGYTLESVKDDLLNEFDRDLELQREDRLHKYEEYLKEEKEHIAKNLITQVIQRYSAPTSVEKKSSTLTVTRDEIKGKLIGAKAENLLLIEELTGVDIIFNDSPDTIIVSCFDLVRRHIARETISKLMKERIVNPDKVREKLKEVEFETDRSLIKIGRDTVRMLGLEHRQFPPEFMKTIGRLKFRTSYGQNILKHSFEVGYFTLMLGGELGVNMVDCKIGGFFHDLGKAIDQEVGGSHDVLTKEIMEKYTFSEDEIHAAWAHHDAIPQRTAEAMLVKAGDAISAGRPGARQESLEKYIERIQAIERISNSYEGVSKSFAISAGREVRVIVEPQRLKDDDLPYLAENIAEEIQANVGYPGKIKINVIRRTKNIDYAKAKDGSVVLPKFKK